MYLKHKIKKSKLHYIKFKTMDSINLIKQKLVENRSSASRNFHQVIVLGKSHTNEQNYEKEIRKRLTLTEKMDNFYFSVKATLFVWVLFHWVLFVGSLSSCPFSLNLFFRQSRRHCHFFIKNRGAFF